MHMHACVHFVFGLGFLVPGRPPDIYANILNSEANQESETLLSQHFGKRMLSLSMHRKRVCCGPQKNGEGAALRKTDK